MNYEKPLQLTYKLRYSVSKKQIPKTILNNTKMSERSRWTIQQIQRLQEIYEEQSQLGEKRLWSRITKRINKTVRPSKRQAIQYKWKNFCKNSSKSIKLSSNQQLLNIIMSNIHQKGYKELSLTPQLKGISQSNIKNIFYSNVRSMANFLCSYITQNSQSTEEVNNMLKNRKFLRLLNQNSIDFAELRRKINQMKKISIKNSRSVKNQSDLNRKSLLREQISSIFNKMKTVYKQSSLEQYKRKIFIMSKSSNQDLSNTADLFIEEFKMNKVQQRSIQIAFSIKNKQTLGDIKEEGLGLIDDNSFKLNSPDDYQFQEHQSGYFSISQWIFNDF